MQYDCPCYFCEHYIGKRKCKAFPDGIPEDISIGGNDHKKPYKGDNGIQFKQAKKPKFK